MTYRCNHFKIQELVTPEAYTALGENAWILLRPELLIVLDMLRERFGVVTVNDWARGGNFRESGLRLPATATGAAFSMHKVGGAADLKFASVTPEEVQEEVLKEPSKFSSLTCMENAKITKTWLHVDVRAHLNSNQIIIVNP